jgi:UTP--glucose-1-phosphate uridylyltransferase
VLEALEARRTGAGGEIQLTDAVAAGAGGDGVWGYRFEGERFDCGSKAGFLRATVAFALRRDDLAGEFSAYLEEIRRMRIAAE